MFALRTAIIQSVACTHVFTTMIVDNDTVETYSQTPSMQVLKIQMLDKMRQHRRTNAIFATREEDDDITTNIRSNFQPRKMQLDQSNDHLDMTKLKGNLDNVYSQLQELASYINLS